MNAVLITVILVTFTLLWRSLTSWEIVQKVLHSLGPLAWLLQWYTILFVGVGYLVARTFGDIVTYEYLKYDFLLNADSFEDDNFVPGISDEERRELVISPWLRKFSLIAPAAGAFAALVVAQHVYAIVKANAARTAHLFEQTPSSERRSSRPLKWYLHREMNMVMLVVAMPIVFILMAMRAEVRIWAVMTGSCFTTYKEKGGGLDEWDYIKTLELSTYTGDIEMCGFFVYITIFAFGRLCTAYLRNAPPQYQATLKYAGLQGVYLYVLFGLLRSVGNIAAAVGADSPKYRFVAAQIQDKVLTQIAPVFTTATILCVYNMFVICGMCDVKAKLGNANMKFQGVRFLVLVAQIQLAILQAFTEDSPVFVQAQEKLPPKYAVLLKDWHLSSYRAKLIHAALLNYECVFVVLFQRCVWRESTAYARAVAVDNDDLRERLLVTTVDGGQVAVAEQDEDAVM